MAFAPNFTISAATAKALMGIEAARTAVDGLPVSPVLIASLRESARLLSTHLSTQIEGNRLTLPEVEELVARRSGAPGRTRDEREVLNYYLAAGEAEAIAARVAPFTESDIQLLHGL